MTTKGKQIIERAVGGGNLPSLSPIAMRLLQVAADENASARDMAALISQDPGLATRLLRLVNSAAYRRAGGEIADIERAVVMLGQNEMRVLALSMSLKDVLPAKGGEHDYHLFWRTSLHRAILAREVAMKHGRCSPEEAFMAGLICEIGLPLMLRVLSPSEAAEFPGFERSLKEQVVWAHRSLGTDHRQLGRAVLEAWNMPRVLIDSQRIIPPLVHAQASVMALICDFARRAAESFFAPGVELEEVHQVAALRFEWPADQVNQLLFDSLGSAGETAEALEIDLDQEQDIVAVLEKARLAIIAQKGRLAQELRDAPDGDQRRRILDRLKSPLLGLAGLVRKLTPALAAGGENAVQAQAASDEVTRLDQALAQIEAALAKRA